MMRMKNERKRPVTVEDWLKILLGPTSQRGGWDYWVEMPAACQEAARIAASRGEGRFDWRKAGRNGVVFVPFPGRDGKHRTPETCLVDAPPEWAEEIAKHGIEAR